MSCHPYLQGLGQTVAFCGDGLNDLAALVTAEVGLAIGPIDAMAAAPVSTKRSSIAGATVFRLCSVNKKINPTAKGIGIFNFTLPLHIVAIQLKPLTPVSQVQHDLAMLLTLLPPSASCILRVFIFAAALWT